MSKSRDFHWTPNHLDNLLPRCYHHLLNMENESLKKEILETIEEVFARPEMFGHMESVETLFFVLFTLVAPYAWNLDSIKAGEMTRDYVVSVTHSPLGLCGTCKDHKELVSRLSAFYRGFQPQTNQTITISTAN